MFGQARVLEAVAALEARTNTVATRIDGVVFPRPSTKNEFQWVWFPYNQPSRYCAGADDVESLRDELRALGAALGYRWVPGKTEVEVTKAITEAHWEKVADDKKEKRRGR